jgi:hypothetical protein
MRPSNDREAISLILHGLEERGVIIDESHDGAGEVLIHTDHAETLDWLTSCDDSTLSVTLPNGQASWVYFVLGNEPEEVACDYGVSLSEFIDPITDPWWDR